jgi:riboflavin synthase
MFTGIIQTVGTIAAIEPGTLDTRMTIAAGKLDLSDVKLGDSIAVSGACLTVVGLSDNRFSVDVSKETLACTTLGGLKVDSHVNLEKALTLSDRLGGHLVSGHVDGVGVVVSRTDLDRMVQFTVKAPEGLAKYIAKKGSICVDGTSLTINEIRGSEFELLLIPHTLQETIADNYQPGTQVNLEVDLIARYLERLMIGAS